MAYETILTEIKDNIGIITLNRPQELNALSREMTAELSTALVSLSLNQETRCIVMIGSEKAFCAGPSLSELQARQNDTLIDSYQQTQSTFWTEIHRCRKPILAAVSGYSLGSGLELALVCDLIIAAENAKFGLPEITRATLPQAGGIQRLTRLIGKAKAMDIILTGRQIDAIEAERVGLVSRVVATEDLFDQTLTIAQRICEFSQPIIWMAKQAIQAAFQTSLDDGLRFEQALLYSSLSLRDRQEGIASFLEKRRPDFKNF